MKQQEQVHEQQELSKLSPLFTDLNGQHEYVARRLISDITTIGQLQLEYETHALVAESFLPDALNALGYGVQPVGLPPMRDGEFVWFKNTNFLGYVSERYGPIDLGNMDLILKG